MEIPIGTKLEKKLLVDNEVAINFLGMEGARVLATPWMIGWMERTCRDAVLPLLDAGHDTVGTHVDVYHLAATPMGMTVTFKAEVIGVEGAASISKWKPGTRRRSAGRHARAGDREYRAFRGENAG